MFLEARLFNYKQKTPIWGPFVVIICKIIFTKISVEEPLC